MINFFKRITRKRNGLKIEKSEIGEEWQVKKGFNILYIGSKEKCEIFANQGQLA